MPYELGPNSLTVRIHSLFQVPKLNYVATEALLFSLQDVVYLRVSPTLFLQTSIKKELRMLELG